MSQKKNFKRITLVLKPKAINEFSNLVPNLYNWLKKRKKTVQFMVSDKDRIGKLLKRLDSKEKSAIKFITAAELFKGSDLIISLGGDGTLIGIAKNATTNKTPIFGVNMGRLGFITEFSKSDFYDHLQMILKGKYILHKKNLFSAKVYEGEKTVYSKVFFNDAVVNKNDISRMFALSVDTNEDHVFNLSGDGIIVSTTVGSTAYSLAAGGPIVHPEVQALILTPICPHGLTHRPLVIPDTSQISIQLYKNEESACLTLDGQSLFLLKSGQKLVIRKATRRSVHFIKNKERTYYQTLKEKFELGKREHL